MTVSGTNKGGPTPLAIIGMGCRFPGADNLEQFWDMLVQGRSALGQLPADRFDRETSYSPERGLFGKTYCDLGGVVSPQPLDPAALHFDAAIASRYDVSHLTLCEVVAAACRDAAYEPRSLPERKTGVYVGNSSGGSELECRTAYHRHAPAMAALLDKTSGFDQLAPETRAAVISDVIQSIRRDYPDRHTLDLVGLSPHVAATMLVELLGLQGPALVADAACASSFVALNIAAQALASGEIDMAIVAGAAQRKLYEWVAIAQAGAMSITGCCPFDAAADGIICSDGYGAILVKRLDQALVDGDNIRGVIRGIGMASDGRGKGFWAPIAAGQAKAIRRAYESGVDPAGLQYIEAHATSTQLGDKTEIESLTLALGDSLSHKIPVASVKGNIGHTLEAAGMAGMIKTLLAMEHGVVPPAPNLQTLSTGIPWDDVPFFVPDRPIEWSPADGNHIRRAGVNSFGIGGLNLHVVIDQAPEAIPGGVLPPPGLLTPTVQKLGQVQPRIEKPGISKMPGFGREPIAIVGVSCLLPGAQSPGELWQLLESGRDVRRPVSNDRWAPETLCKGSAAADFRGGFLDNYEFDWKTFRIPPKQLEAANPLQFLILDAAARALADAGIDEKPLDRERAAAIVGTIFRGDYIIDHWYGVWMPEFVRRLTTTLADQQVPHETAQQIVAEYAQVLAAEKPAARDETGSISSSTLAARITKHFDLNGGAYSIDAADVSGAAALASAIDLLNSGDSDTIICAAGQRSLDVTIFEEYDRSTTPDATPAEGVVCLVLKRLSDAEEQGDRVRGILHASTVIGNDSSEVATQAAADRAFATSCFDPGQVSLSAAPANDSRPLGSTQQQIGDLQGGSVLLSLLQTLLMLEHGRSPAAAGGQPIHAGTDQGSGLVSLGQISRRGFSQNAGGMASHLLLEAGHGLLPRPDDTTSDSQHMTTKGVAMSSTSDGAQQPDEPITEFDATTARKQRMREEALARRPPTSSEPTSTPAAASSRGADRAVSPPIDIPDVNANGTMKRFVLKTVPAPLPADVNKSVTFAGPALVLGSNPTADALKQKLLDLGVTVHQLDSGIDPAAAVGQLDAYWQAGPIPQLFLVTARDEEAAVDLKNPASWDRCRDAGIMLPWAVCQRWFALVEQAKLVDRASVVAVTALGGDFGFSGNCPAVEGGGLAGLLKSLHNETRRKLAIKIIDTPRRDPAKLVATEVLGELAAGCSEQEIGYIRGQRKVVRALPQPTSTLGRRTIEPGGVWLVTGGARGVTAETALELGRRYNLRMHLVGSSPQPQIPDAWRNLDADGMKQLRAEVVRKAITADKKPLDAWNVAEKAIEIDATLSKFQDAGVAATYHSCDVTDTQSLAALLDQIRKTDGPIDGIIHGAGAEYAGQFIKKQPEKVARVLGSKLTGTLALMALTEQDRPKYFVAFGSTSGRFGGYLQTDYSLANEMLCKIVNYYADTHPDCAALSFHWTAWDEVGMAATPHGELILDNLGVQRMPLAEGIGHLIEELTSKSNDSEILICDHPGGVHSDQLLFPDETQLQVYDKGRELLSRSPIVDNVYVASPTAAVAWATFDPTSDPFLLCHLDNGIPLFPAVMGIETCAAAAAIATGGKQVVELCDFKLLNGLRMALERPYRTVTHLSLDGNTVAFRVGGDFYDKQGQLADPERQYQSGIVELAEAPRVIPPPDFGSPPTNWTKVPYPEDWQTRTGFESGTVFYGPALRELTDVCYLPDNSAWGKVHSPPLSTMLGNRSGDGWQTAAAVLDAVLLGCDLFASHLHQSQQFPHEIERLQFGRLPREGEQCLSRTFFKGRDGRHFVFDFWLIGDDGDVIFQSEGCRFIDINYSNKAATAQATAAS